MTKHMIEGAVAAMLEHNTQQAETQRTYMDLDNTGLEGARSDKDVCDESSLLKAIRALNDFIRRVAIGKMLEVDVTSEDPDYVRNGMVTWPSIKMAERVLISALRKCRVATVAGPMGGRTGTTTGSFETESKETKQQVHLATVPHGDDNVPGLVRWEYHPARYEMNSDGSVACFPYWEVEPIIEMVLDPETGEETGEEIEVKAGVKHDRAGEPIAMWRLTSLCIFKGDNLQVAELTELVDAVHSAQMEVHKNRRREENEATSSNNPQDWGTDTSHLVG